MQKIVPNIWCNRNAEDVARFYASVFPDSEWRVASRYPDTDLPDFQKDFAGDVLTIDMTIAGTDVALINADDMGKPNPAISFMVNVDPLFYEGSVDRAREALDELWVRLAEGGTVLMPLDAYPFSARYGWVQDRFGFSWQLMLTDPEGDPRPFLLPALLFAGPAQNLAETAVDRYVSVFDDAALGARVHYAQQTGPASAGAVQFSDFRIGDQWIVAMDSGVPQDFTFGYGTSLEVRCDDQAEIDRYWEGLSHDPDAEACGWLRDFAGLNWQIVPKDMEELMKHPGAYGRMLEMKKIIIAEL